ncbi:MAG: MSMEG_0567/Sll0786 family nitrogen starvation N-acetyltransferase [Polyangiales bacterium]
MLEATRPYGAPVKGYTSPTLSFALAREPWQLRGYWALRREIFCRETQLFSSSLRERDEHDRRALPIVALAHCAGLALDVVGVVRIYEDEPGVWYGGRLGVSAAYRKRPSVGSGLIATAVGLAKGQGCERFLARVLAENGRYFGRHHFATCGELELCGRRHFAMQADLDAFVSLPAAVALGGATEAA